MGCGAVFFLASAVEGFPGLGAPLSGDWFIAGVFLSAGGIFSTPLVLAGVSLTASIGVLGVSDTDVAGSPVDDGAAVCSLSFEIEPVSSDAVFGGLCKFFFVVIPQRGALRC